MYKFKQIKLQKEVVGSNSAETFPPKRPGAITEYIYTISIGKFKHGASRH